MSTPRAVRIPRSGTPSGGSPGAHPLSGSLDVPPRESDRRPNVAGSQRAIRLAILFLVALAALFAAFLLYDRGAPGGASSPAANGILVLSLIFIVFAVGGFLFTVTPAPRSVEVAPDGVVVVGRWGRRVSLPPLALLKLRVVRKYPANWLATADVELVELWSDGMPPRNYLVESGLFAGSTSEALRP